MSTTDRKKGGRIVDRILAGETCAIVSDAGMPAISDPGEDLVALCDEHDVPVLVVPGRRHHFRALAVSGLQTGRFTFEGFLSVNKRAMRPPESVKNEVRTMVFYEAPHKLPYTLRDMAEVFGDRRIALVRDYENPRGVCAHDII